jgi:LysM repeat protein
MKKISMLTLLLGTSFFLYSILLCGCANLGVTEPVLGSSPASPSPSPSTYQLSGESRFSSAQEMPSKAPVMAHYDDSSLLRELAALRADFRVLQEENQKLAFRMENLERENLAKDAQLKELQSLLSALDGQVASADKQWSERMENLRRNMDAEREQRRLQLESLSSNVAQELSKVQSKPPTVIPAVSGGKFKEIVIQKGDTLSTIAVATGTTVLQLKQFNGLQSDNIRIGQVLKIPVK